MLDETIITNAAKTKHGFFIFDPPKAGKCISLQ